MNLSPEEFARLEQAEYDFRLGTKDADVVRAVLRALYFDPKIIEAYLDERPVFSRN